MRVSKRSLYCVILVKKVKREVWTKVDWTNIVCHFLIWTIVAVRSLSLGELVSCFLLGDGNINVNVSGIVGDIF